MLNCGLLSARLNCSHRFSLMRSVAAKSSCALMAINWARIRMINTFQPARFDLTQLLMPRCLRKRKEPSSHLEKTEENVRIGRAFSPCVIRMEEVRPPPLTYLGPLTRGLIKRQPICLIAPGRPMRVFAYHCHVCALRHVSFVGPAQKYKPFL